MNLKAPPLSRRALSLQGVGRGSSNTPQCRVGFQVVQVVLHLVPHTNDISHQRILVRSIGRYCMADYKRKRCHRSQRQVRHPRSTDARTQERDRAAGKKQPKDTFKNRSKLGVRVLASFVYDWRPGRRRILGNLQLLTVFEAIGRVACCHSCIRTY